MGCKGFINSQVPSMISLWGGGAACPMCSRLEGRGSQRSATLNINRHEPLARIFSAAREAAHSQISTNQKRCPSEPRRPVRTAWFRKEGRIKQKGDAGCRGGKAKEQETLIHWHFCRKHFHSVWSLNVNPTWKHHNLLFLLDCHFFNFYFLFFLHASKLEGGKNDFAVRG